MSWVKTSLIGFVRYDVLTTVRTQYSSLLGVLAAALMGCGPTKTEVDPNAIAVGALLPFTGKEAAIGRNLEQALLLAVKDVNEAGGVGGRKLRLITRDSNSGSDRGFSELLQLLYTDKVDYLIGPEETELALGILPDVKGLDLLNILPGNSAPSIEQTSIKGGWIRLAPSTASLACAMAQHVAGDGVQSVNVLVTQDDYNASLASDFISAFGALRGTPLPSVTAPTGATSYIRQINQALDYDAERTLLMAPPASAATIATEWTVMGRRGAWYLSPLLRTEAFLQNVPFGTLEGTHGLSPSLGLKSECQKHEVDTADTDGSAGAGSDAGSGGAPGELSGSGGAGGEASGSGGAGGESPAVPEADGAEYEFDEMTCTLENAHAFSNHFASYWEGDRPFPTSHFYYDAVVLLALGLERGLSQSGELPRGRELRDHIRSFGTEGAQPARWHDLRGPLTEIRLGTTLRYVGAGTEYSFDAYGGAEHTVFDTWSISGDAFVDTGSRYALCVLSGDD